MQNFANQLPRHISETVLSFNIHTAEEIMLLYTWQPHSFNVIKNALTTKRVESVSVTWTKKKTLEYLQILYQHKNYVTVMSLLCWDGIRFLLQMKNTFS